MKKNLVIIGSTGSIGTQTLDVVRTYPDHFGVLALAAGKNVKKMEEQVREFHPKFACLFDETAAKDLSVRIADTDTKVLAGMDGMVMEAVMRTADVFVNAVVGMIGIEPTLAAINAGKTIALANKETLVTAGHLITRAAEEEDVSIIPVDSEHSAIYQCLRNENHKRIDKILLTCSGGTFRGKKRAELVHLHAKDALKNPNWDMGAKVTIDSASLVNKGLEVMEARWLFDVPVDRIEVLVQPQSICHSAVQFQDGAVIAQLASPDMHLPIQYALTCPDRFPLAIKPLDLTEVGSLIFEKPDTETFRGLPLAIQAAKAGGSMPTAFNAANEEAVALFLKDKIEFLDIYDLIEKAMAAHQVIPNPTLEQILQTEKEARENVERFAASGS
ncbi:MAG: 1-deoxy-D-xylulose-5-phosphate reductoisomerase [Lachnospiraceae bacterium]|jgi:1-deoxy-D-xylulose-5-phosphate reductoisomerase|nr:1-deoxy-D-xylulose-5-phosphate reductoisomerase [Lachnospiraceae bacterium]MCI1398927.1 1-deoxy-D-xylulose-5-phosphate reductoisomerase [Lachnospiraceae bacterium]MCI1424926.1 1-deoxy-D-xylulose-5-phosphate reductoisomerase [Lachnospiraceae bacterium]MCI1453609.1 1-deoxy-D-xylulose-5-phosphate reductoisomerase [Lachnospiraceae bacterium]MDD5847831.1 1-deoxy-D-xylulose-5-phosphate reductoisomerase [Bacillota bacterium]